MRENDSSRNDGGGKNCVIYMGLISGPNKADDTCGKTTVTGTMERGSTVLVVVSERQLLKLRYKRFRIKFTRFTYWYK
jgi:hypothetical protein